MNCLRGVGWFVLCCSLFLGIWGKAVAQQQTFCNPINLNCRFSYDRPSYREAADPVVHLYKGNYFLYASKSGGYWYSPDMLKWTFRASSTLPVEDYAPAVETIQDTVLFIASSGKASIYYNTNPLEDNWKLYNQKFPIGMTDPALFKCLLNLH